MKLLSCLAIGSAAFLASGCSLYSSAQYGPDNFAGGDFIEKAIQNNGAPDIIGGNSKYLVVGWRKTKGMSILGLFSTAEEKTYAGVFDEDGKLMENYGSKDNGSALSILGPISPLAPHTSNR